MSDVVDGLDVDVLILARFDRGHTQLFRWIRPQICLLYVYMMEFSGAHQLMWLHLRFKKMYESHWFDVLNPYSHDPLHCLSFVSLLKLHHVRLINGH